MAQEHTRPCRLTYNLTIMLAILTRTWESWRSRQQYYWVKSTDKISRQFIILSSSISPCDPRKQPQSTEKPSAVITHCDGRSDPLDTWFQNMKLAPWSVTLRIWWGCCNGWAHCQHWNVLMWSNGWEEWWRMLAHRKKMPLFEPIHGKTTCIMHEFHPKKHGLLL